MAELINTSLIYKYVAENTPQLAGSCKDRKLGGGEGEQGKGLQALKWGALGFPKKVAEGTAEGEVGSICWDRDGEVRPEIGQDWSMERRVGIVRARLIGRGTAAIAGGGSDEDDAIFFCIIF